MPRVIPTKVLDPSSDGIAPMTKGEMKDTTTTTTAAVVTPTKSEQGDPVEEEEEEGSSGSAEPWDVQRSLSEDASSVGVGVGVSASKTNNASQPTPRYPATTATNSKSKSQYPTSNAMLSSGRRTTRPLSPPSLNGMQQESRSQEDDIETRETSTMEDIADIEEEMPIDERMEYKRQRDLLCGATAVVDEEGAGIGDNLCDYTLTAIGDICAPSTTTTTTKSPAGKPTTARTRRQETLHRARALKAKVPTMKAPYGVEEQTAIEVEYVEPIKTKGKARRAPTAAAGAGSAPPGSNQDNVYANFSATEKRDFLKLINTGISPAEATEKVLQERKTTKAPAPTAAVSTAATSTKSGKGPRLAFWNRGKGQDPAGDLAGDTAPRQMESAPPPSKDGEPFAKSGINYYDAVRKDDSFVAEDEYIQEHQNDNNNKKKKNQSKTAKFGFARLSGNPADDSQSQEAESRHATPPRPTNAARSLPGADGREEVDSSEGVFKPEMATAAAAAVGAGALATGAVVAANAQGEEHDDDDDDSLLRDDDDTDIPVRAHPFKEGSDSARASQRSSRGVEEEKQDVDQELEDEMAAAMLNVSAVSSHSREVNMDLDVETTYMNSTEIMSHYGGGLNTSTDARSVVSGKSYKTSMTYGTMATNYTTSTRNRRPGASKQRITSQKTGESAVSQKGKKVKGWQESIQAAAEGIDRAWDPVHGWVDYENPEVPEGEEKKSDERISINVENIKKATATEGGTPQGLPATISTLAKDGGQPAMIDAFAPPPPPPPRGQAPIVARSVGAAAAGIPDGDNESSPNRSRSWIQTMKEATSKIDTQGKVWDPDRGWITLENGETQELAQSEDRYAGAVDTQAESDTQDFGTVPQDTLMPLPGRSQNVKDPDGQHLIQKNRRDPSGQIHIPVEEDHQSVDASAKSGAAGRYIQIGDTGSVSSYYYGKQSSRGVEKTPGKAAMTKGGAVSTPEMFAKMAQAQDAQEQERRNSGLVDVKRERMNSEDKELFPDLESKGSRRGDGPVDLDEIDDLENGSFVAAADFSWDEDNPNLAEGAKAGNRAAVPRLNMRSAQPVSRPVSGRSVVSSSSASTSRSIPKLRGPKRDTSPIRGRSSSGANVAHTPPEKDVIEMDSKLAMDPSGTQGIISPLGASPGQEPRTGPAPPGSGPDRSLNTPVKSPGAHIDTRSTYTADSSPSTGSVRDLHNYWERRSQGEVAGLPQSAEWKSFLSKKVRAETEAAGTRRSKPSRDDDKDSLFDFKDSEGAFPTARPRARDDGLRSLDEISDISPIQQVHEDDENSETGAPSEASTAHVQGNTFMQRLQACAAPIMPRTTTQGDDAQAANCSPGMPLAHLAFMRTNPAAKGSSPEKNSRSSTSRFVPPNLCGTPDVIVEEDENDLALGVEDSSKKNNQTKKFDIPPRSRSGRQGGDVSSVISDEMTGGNKTAYLEAIAMKAAVSGSKKRRSRGSGGSDVSGSTGTGTSSKHSESWQRFLEKKRANATAQDEKDVSRAAEKYASEKVEKMMSTLASRSPASANSGNFEARPAEEATGAFPSASNVRPGSKTEASQAAEDLAAARVEAMMQALSSSQPQQSPLQGLDEGEAEI